MTTGHVFIATSLDGFIARKDDALDWLPQEETEGEDLGYDAFMASVDGLIMGRGSFENVLTFGFWPYEKPVVVLSKTLTQDSIPAELEGKVRVSNFGPQETMQSLNAQGWKRAYVDGGLLVQSFVRAGLVSDLIITVIPILIGEGKSLFGPLENDINLQLLHSASFGSGLVQNHYKIL